MKKVLLILMSIIICISFVGCIEKSSKNGENNESNIQKEKINSTIKNSFVGDIIKFGKYEQDANEENGKEEIEWTVLDTENNTILLVSSKLLDYKSFYEGETGYWNESEIRQWLNNDFINESFTAEEQKHIRLVNIVTTVYSNPLERFTTEDRVFLMSAEEVEKYFPSRADRLASPTEFANKQYDEAKTYDYIRWFTRNHNDVYGGYSHISINTNKWQSEGLFEEWRYKKPAFIRPAMWIKVLD